MSWHRRRDVHGDRIGRLARHQAGSFGHPGVFMRGDIATMRATVSRRGSIGEAELAGRLTVIGDLGLAERFTRMFPVRRAQPSAKR
jgi:hypothetical protein